MMEKIRVFSGARFALPLGERTYICGIVNVTPDSFSDGGRFLQQDAAVAQALQLEEQGAHLLDIGGQSTRPGHTPVSEEEELARVIPVLRALRPRTGLPISVDTDKPAVARAALAEGADIINDIGGFFLDEMLEVLQQSDAACIAMTGLACDEEKPAPAQVAEHYLRMLLRLRGAGIAPERICLDPGIGFGKTYAQNLALLRDLPPSPCAMLVGASRKSVIGLSCGSPPPKERLAGTIAAHTLAIAGGADILRVHDVAEAVQAAQVADAILRGKE